MRQRTANETIHVLLIQRKSPDDGRVEALLTCSPDTSTAGAVKVRLNHATTLREALDLFNGSHAFEIALLDSNFADATGPTRLPGGNSG